MAGADTLISQSIELMIYGLGTVFLFLILLVIAVQGLTACLRQWFPEPVPTRAPPQRPVGPAAVDDRTRAIIQAAVDRHRQR